MRDPHRRVKHHRQGDQTHIHPFRVAPAAAGLFGPALGRVYITSRSCPCPWRHRPGPSHIALNHAAEDLGSSRATRSSVGEQVHRVPEPAVVEVLVRPPSPSLAGRCGPAFAKCPFQIIGSPPCSHSQRNVVGPPGSGFGVAEPRCRRPRRPRRYRSARPQPLPLSPIVFLLTTTGRRGRAGQLRDHLGAGPGTAARLSWLGLSTRADSTQVVGCQPPWRFPPTSTHF